MIMRKSIFLLGMAALAMASCTNEEVLNVAESNYIRFDRAFVGNPTKVATELTEDNIASFWVYAYADDQALLSNENVYLQGGVWAYDALKQWDSDVTAYSFAAYSNGGTDKGKGKLETGAAYTTAGGLVLTDYTNADGSKDLLVDISSNDLADANVPVEFNFAHALSMVKFTIKSGMGNTKELTITNVAIEAGSVKDKATLTYTEATEPNFDWTDPSGNVNWTLEDGTAKTEAAYEKEFTAIPQTVSDFNLTFTVEVTSTDDAAQPVTKNITAKVPGTTWTEGNRYNYIATITGTDVDMIEFAEPKVTAWVDQDGTETDVTSSPVQ